MPCHVSGWDYFQLNDFFTVFQLKQTCISMLNSTLLSFNVHVNRCIFMVYLWTKHAFRVALISCQPEKKSHMSIDLAQLRFKTLEAMDELWYELWVGPYCHTSCHSLLPYTPTAFNSIFHFLCIFQLMCISLCLYCVCLYSILKKNCTFVIPVWNSIKWTMWLKTYSSSLSI